jgi:hypothetical protein
MDSRVKKKKQQVIFENGYVKIQCKGGFFLIDEEDLEIYLKKSWRINANGYVSTSHGKYSSLHREVMKAKDGQIVDHASRDKADNRKSNLRFCNKSENNTNCKVRKDNTTGYKGVSILQKRGRGGVPRYWAYIDKNNKRTSLGVYKTPEDAAKKWNEAALKIHGEFASLNIIK